MELLNKQLELGDAQIRDAIDLVNRKGFASLALPASVVFELGHLLYQDMDTVSFHPNRQSYYNEIAFYWPEDWLDVDRGIGSFHDQRSLRHILPIGDAQNVLREKLGIRHTAAILNFASDIKRLVIRNHHGLRNNELRLSRVMVRQMNESNQTTHGGSEVHEDIGYTGRRYQQLLSAIVTTHGIPTESAIYQPKLGELLIFNAYDRRRLLGLSDDFAFFHKGPKTGPKMFFFFEFLGPKD